VVQENSEPKHRILCIEDEPGMLDLLQLILEAADYECLRAENGRLGLEAMQRELPDVVLLDLMLPEVDGAEVLLRKKQDPSIRDIPVIAVTALSSAFDQIMWQRHTEIRAYITKPFMRKQILGTIEEVLSGAD
jgi:DNA-binding response OmpR family regulator